MPDKYNNLLTSGTFTPDVIEDIQVKAELGRYRIRGFGTLRERRWATQKRKLDALLRQHLPAFIRKCFQTVCPGESYQHSWYIDCLAWHLEQCLNGRIKRLIITMLPRHLKSISASVAFPAWALGHDPTLQIICVSYSQKLTEKFSRDGQAIMQSPWYRRLFPGTRLSRRKSSADEMETTRKGVRYSTSIGGTLTGRGGNIIIIDDPLKLDEAMSEAEREAVNQWFDTTCYSRLNNKKEDVIIIVTQRSNVNDLVAHVMEKEEWTVVNIPAIPDEDTRYQIGDDEHYDRPAGELLNPAREDEETLAKIRANLGSYNFEAQYQQRPMPPEGNLLKRRWLRWYSDLPDWSEFEHVAQSWDTAGSSKELSSYSVCTTWGVIDWDYYLIDVVRERLEYPDLKRRVVSEARKYTADIVLVEYAGSGRSLIQDLRRRGPVPLRPVRPEKDKVTRLAAQSAKIEGGQVHLPENAPWLDEFLREVLAFPNSRYNDQVDSLSQALAYLGHWSRLHGERVRPNPKRPDDSRWVRKSGKEGRREGRRRSGYQRRSGLYYRRGWLN